MTVRDLRELGESLRDERQGSESIQRQVEAAKQLFQRERTITAPEERCETCDGSGILWPLDPREPDEVCEYCDGTGTKSRGGG